MTTMPARPSAQMPVAASDVMLELRHLSKRFGSTKVLHDIDLVVPRGSFTVFVGPSGCGKSTLLRLIAGLDAPSDGQILIDGRRVDTLPPAARGVSMVFQSYALYPHMTARRNIGFGLKIAGQSAADIEARVARVAGMLQIGSLLDRKPAELSGGQRQRVAIARAIVRDPKVFLFDEPLSNLDAALRAETRVELARMHADLGATMIHVTHDQVEAMTLADQLVVLNGGRIEQVGPPADLYRHPRSLFVARFLGSPQMNLFTATAMAASHDGTTATPSGASCIGIRPEDLTLADQGRAAIATGRLIMVEELGETRILHVDIGAASVDGRPVTLRHRPAPPAIGSPVTLTADPADWHPFDHQGRRLPR
ncbi:ABC transporter ATP-binding protein [Tistrella bauzanensis]|jgi:multiple sugar transport system ATP-binding protein|uniref:ABC transporter ATP-binding protein n=1 Tax=Tistrella TaxID=171436 RepID=UPI0031F63669